MRDIAQHSLAERGEGEGLIRQRLADRLEATRAKHAWVDHLVRAELRFRQERIHNNSVVVTYRALFLSIVLMVALLYVLGVITAVLPGANEIVIPVLSVPADADLGAIVNENFTHSSGKVVNLVGILTLAFSAIFTAKALRQGSEIILRPDRERKIRSYDVRNLLAGVLIAVVVLVSWLLVLATAVRRAAFAEITGLTSPESVNLVKALTVLAAWVLVTVVVSASVRAVDDRHRTRTILVASMVFAVFVVLANFVLIYAYVAALVDPDTSGSVVLVLTILAWVNVVVRGFFYAECWIAEAPSGDSRAKDTTGDLHSRG